MGTMARGLRPVLPFPSVRYHFSLLKIRYLVGFCLLFALKALDKHMGAMLK